MTQAAALLPRRSPLPLGALPVSLLSPLSPLSPQSPRTALGRGIALVAAFLVSTVGSVAFVSSASASTALLTQETFNNATVLAPGDWLAGSGGTTAFAPCLTAGTSTTASPFPGCAPSGADAATKGALRLTDTGGSEATYVLFNHPLSTAGGLDISFNQAQYGGSGADGISFFLVDGSTNLTHPGQLGGYLGYGAGGTGSPTGGVGVDRGLFNVGLDAYGNNGTNAYNGGGCAATSPYSSNSNDPNNVILRGAGNGSTGYCYLTSSKQQSHPVTLHYASGPRTSATHAIRITAEPSQQSSPVITVYVDGTAVLSAAEPAELTAASSFKFGFTASSGGSTDDHEIWNVVVNSMTALAPQLSLSAATVSGNPPAAGGTTTFAYTATVSSTGGSEAQPLTVTQSLPGGATVASRPSGTGWDCSATVVGSSTLSCTYTPASALRPGSVLPLLDVPVAVPTSTPGGTDMSSTAQVSDGTVTATATPAVTGGTTVPPHADLSVALSGPATVAPGAAVTYHVAVGNGGTDSAQSVVVTDQLPTALTGGSATDPGCSVAGGRLTCTRSSLASGGGWSFDITGTAPADGSQPADGTVLSNQASVTSNTSDPNTANNTSATVTTSVVGSADLRVSVSGPTTVAPGAKVTYTVTVTNPAGGNSARSVTLTDSYPASLTSVTAPGGCAVDRTAHTVTCTASAVAANTSTFYTISGLAPTDGGTPADGAALVDTASVSSLTSDPDSSNNTGQSATTTVTGSADLAVTVSGPSTVAPGGTVTYSITATDNGPDDAVAPTVTDDVPVALTDVAAPGCTVTGNHVSCSRSSLPKGTPWTVTVTATAPADGATPADGTTFDDSASISSSTADPATGDNTSAQVRTTVVGQADLATDVTSSTTVAPGGTLTYTVAVTNHGPDAAVAPAVVDDLPNGLTDASTTSPGCAISTAGGVTALSCSRPSLAAGGTWTVTVTGNAPADGSGPGGSGPGGSAPADGATLVDQATASSQTADPTPGNNTSQQVTTTVVGSADLQLALDAPATARPGAHVSYGLTVTNAGPDGAVHPVVTDVLPDNLDNVSVTDPACTLAGGVLTCRQPAIAAGAQWRMSVTGTAPADGSTPADGSVVTDNASVTATTADPVSANDTAGATTRVVASADLAVTVDAPATVAPGAQVSATVTVTDTGDAARNPVVVVTVPSQLTGVSVSGCTVSGTTATCRRTSISGGESWTIAVSGDAPADTGVPVDGTALDVRTKVSSDSADPDTGNDSGSATTVVSSAADLAVSVAGPATVAPGAPVTYTIDVVDNGPDTAAGLRLTDALPAGLTAASSTDAGCSVTAGVLGCTTATLAGGAHWTVTVHGTAPADGTGAADGAQLVDQASVTAATYDGNPTNNVSQSVTSNVVGSADLAVTMAAPATVAPGAATTYTLTVADRGPDAAGNLTLTATLPATLTAPTITGSGCAVVAGTLTCTRAALAGGATWTVTVSGTAPVDGADPVDGEQLIGNAAVVSSTADPDLTNNAGAATTTVVASADLAVDVVGPADVVPGAAVGYTVTVTNHGPDTAVAPTLTDELPPALTSVATATPGCAVVTGVLTCSQPSLAAGATWTATVTGVAPDAALTLVDDAVVASSTADPDPTNNTSRSVSTAITPRADLGITVSAPTTVRPGAALGYTVTVVNRGPDRADAPTVVDDLPADVTGITAPGCTVRDGSGSAGTVTCGGPSMAVGSSWNVTLAGHAPSDGVTAADGIVLTDRASVSAATTDPQPADNTSAGVTTTVVGKATIHVRIAGPTSVQQGSRATFSVLVGNDGPDAAAHPALTDVLPGGFADVRTPTPGCSVSGQVLRCTTATLAAGGSWPVTFSARLDGTGALTQHVTATAADAQSTTVGTTAATATHTTTVQAVPALVTPVRPPATPVVAPAGGRLPFTGFDALWWASGGALLLVGGALLLLRTRPAGGR